MNKLLLALLLTSNIALANDSDYIQLGQKEGCSSGKYIAGSTYFQYQKDNSYYTNNSAYRQAWDIAFERCKIQGMQENDVITRSLMQWR